MHFTITLGGGVHVLQDQLTANTEHLSLHCKGLRAVGENYDFCVCSK